MAAKASERLNIPILFLGAGNPQMLVKSFKSSGCNLAGISSGSLELVGKRFEILRGLSPKAKKVAMPIDPSSLVYKANVAEAQQSAARLGFMLREIPVESAEGSRAQLRPFFRETATRSLCLRTRSSRKESRAW